jgi:hypothetical protein
MTAVWFLALWFCTDGGQCESYDQFRNQPRPAFTDYGVCENVAMELENSGLKVQILGREYWIVGTCVDRKN